MSLQSENRNLSTNLSSRDEETANLKLTCQKLDEKLRIRDQEVTMWVTLLPRHKHDARWMDCTRFALGVFESLKLTKTTLREWSDGNKKYVDARRHLFKQTNATDCQF